MEALGLILMLVCHVAMAIDVDGPEYLDFLRATGQDEKFALDVDGPEYLDFLRATGQDEKFAQAMGLPDPSLVRPSSERSELLEFGGSPVSELGDILLTEKQLEQSRQGINFQIYGGSKWQNNVIPYIITTSDYTVTQIATINSALQALSNSLTKLKIRPKLPTDQDYAVVFSGNGCYSNLGRIGGKQSVSLQANGCMRVGTIQHEFIHAAGFVHEHMRPDRDNYIKILPQNIPPEWQSQYNKVSTPDFGNQGTYDYYSVMHYPVLAPGTNLPAFQVLNPTINQQNIGQRNGPTAEDIRNINQLYP